MMAEWDKVRGEDKRKIEPFLQEVPIRIVGMAKALGIDVVKADLGPRIIGEIKQKNDTEYLIRVHMNEPYEDRRFTIAHEIAHYLLHKEEIGDGMSDSPLYHSSTSNELEVEANRLAVSLLTPGERINEVLKKRGWGRSFETAKKMATEFAVPTWLMKIKLGV